jgi:2-C-methyl-D-erythritol 4-phosphate cytidylyltransferase/2-C-methyl-D-erythritol 2,4-cyclodiphosphate synthase
LLNVSLIVLCAGNSTRFGDEVKKQWLRVDNEPLWLYVTKRVSKSAKFSKVVVTASKDEIDYMRKFNSDFEYVVGGDTRQESIKNALDKIDSEYVMITDVARACVPKKVIKRLIENIANNDIVVPYLNVSDTVVYQNSTIDRDEVKLIQTPQLSKTSTLNKALKSKIDYTDDSSAISAIGGEVKYVKGSKKSVKITFKDDIKNFKSLKAPNRNIFVGQGFDIHPFESAKEMYLGGVKIDSEYGFKAHSDGDVLIHSLIDALVGAIGAGDIGEFFPDTSSKYKNIDSKILLEEIVLFTRKVGFNIINVDITIIAQKPRVGKYKDSIKNTLAQILKIKPYLVNIKATTAEKLGFIGRGEGVAVLSNANLEYYRWKK